MRLGAVPLRVLLAWAGVGGAVALLASRLAHDVGTLPYSEDEAVAGLIAARPLGEMLKTVVWYRGGSPLHFTLVHAAFWVSATPATLRWLSVVCALGTVVCTYLLARELGGNLAGVAAAWLVATSDLLRVYGTFGRMYSLFALAGSLNLLLFLRALRHPSPRRVWLAAASAWLLAATQPFGLIPAGAEAAVALFLWRGRGWKAALPGAVATLAAIPLFAGELRLAARFGVTGSHGTSLGGGGAAKDQLDSALRGYAGGNGAIFWLFVVLALAGAVAAWRRSPGLTLAGASALLCPPALSLLAHAHSPDATFLSPRHLIVALPFWATLIGLGAVELTRLAPARDDIAVVAVLAVAVLAVLAPRSTPDPRTQLAFWEATGAIKPTRVAGAWLAQRIRPGDVFYPYSVPFLQALPAARTARGLPRSDAHTLRETLGSPGHVGTVWVTLPLGVGDATRPTRLRALERTYEVGVFRNWLVVGARGPFTGRAAVLQALRQVIGAAATTIEALQQDTRVYESLTREIADQAARG